MSRKRMKLTGLALVAVGAGLIVGQGCSKKQEQSAAPSGGSETKVEKPAIDKSVQDEAARLKAEAEAKAAAIAKAAEEQAAKLKAVQAEAKRLAEEQAAKLKAQAEAAAT